MAAAWLLALAALGYLVVTAVHGQMLIDSLIFLAREAWPLLERTGGTLVAVSTTGDSPSIPARQITKVIGAASAVVPISVPLTVANSGTPRRSRITHRPGERHPSRARRGFASRFSLLTSEGSRTGRPEPTSWPHGACLGNVAD